jgi:hypothetical protein
MLGQMLEEFNIGYAEKGKSDALAAPSNKQLKIHSVVALNRSGAAIDTGLCRKLAERSWEFGQLVDASAPDFVDATDAIQAGTATDIFTTTNNDGFLVQAEKSFNIIGLNVSTASAGGVFEYTYFNGTAYVALTTIEVPSYASTGTKLIVFPAPSDWVKGTTVAVGGSTSLYSIRVRATTAPAAAVQANDLWVAKFIAFHSALVNNASLEVNFDGNFPLVFDALETVMPYFGTASAANMVMGFYTLYE